MFSVITAILFTLVLSFNPVKAQDDDNSITIGERVTIHSDVLGEDRVLLVHTPPGYNQFQGKYPVMYILDGDGHFHHATGVVRFLSAQGIMPQMIVVALRNTDRNRDFLPTNMEQIPTSGGADNFIKFFNEELIPYIDENYRTEPYKILVGHSFGGVFAVHALLASPETFDSYISISPSLWWDDELLKKNAETFLKQNKELEKVLFITLGNEGDRMIDPANNFTKVLKDNAPDGLEWKYLFMENDDHGSTPHKSIYEALELIYSGWRLPFASQDIGLDKLKEHYKTLSDKFGYNIEPSEAMVNILGYQVMEQDRKEEAIKIFQLNVEKYPNSANVYDSLGEGYENNEQYELAKKNYTIAIEKGEANSDPFLNVFKEHLVRVQEKIDNQ
jgi:predicted alpha/beta superfamily hydrolase